MAGWVPRSSIAAPNQRNRCCDPVSFGYPKGRAMAGKKSFKHDCTPGWEFEDLNMAGSIFNNVNLRGSRFHDINFSDVLFTAA
jgi:hypothetical protein